MKKIFLIIIFLLICLSFNVNVFGIENYIPETKLNNFNNAPVFGEFKYDIERLFRIRRKEKMAEEYYEAKINGEFQKADSVLKSFKTFNSTASTPLPLAHEKSMRNSSSYQLPIMQIPQDTNFYCGYASIKSLLNFAGIYKSQIQIAREVYRTNISCPWYLAHGNSLNQFPVPNYLTNQLGYFYEPFPYGAAGTVPISDYEVKAKVVTTIDSDHGLMACGTSNKNSEDLSHLPNYPTDRTVTHWIVINGYQQNGDHVTIADPAKSPNVSWSNNIDAYYSISVEKLAAFCKTHGLVW